MARYAIGDVQGCGDELRALVNNIGFSADRDTLWFVGDLVNRGPQSLQVLRLVRALGDNAVSVLGNHDLHLLAVAFGKDRRLRKGDTLDDVLGAPDRNELLRWLMQRPLAYSPPSNDAAASRRELLIHAGLVPQWSVEDTLRLATQASAALQEDPETFVATMYGNRPDRWSPDLDAADRNRFVVNVLTRLRFCSASGVLDLKSKGAADSAPSGFQPWFDAPKRRSQDTRIIFGHWSTLGLLQRQDVLALDTGCVWGGALTAVDLDSGRVTQVPSRTNLPPL